MLVMLAAVVPVFCTVMSRVSEPPTAIGVKITTPPSATVMTSEALL